MKQLTRGITFITLLACLISCNSVVETPLDTSDVIPTASREVTAVAQVPSPTSLPEPTPTPVPPTATAEPTLTPTRLPTPSPEPTVTSTPSPAPSPTATLVVDAVDYQVTPGARAEPLLSRVITSAEMNAIESDLGINDWQLASELVWNSRVCREFYGESWSINENISVNCIFTKPADFPFDGAIEAMFDFGILYPTAVTLPLKNNYEQEVALYADRLGNGQAVYDLFVDGQTTFYWASVSVGVPVGYTAEMLYEEIGDSITHFLFSIVEINLMQNGS